MFEDSPNISISTGEESEEETPPPTEQEFDVVIDAADVTVVDVHADCVAKMTHQQGTIAELRGIVDTLRYTQISGDDSRLGDFWAKAQELADEAGHCSVYDEIAEALGGPARERDYDVTVTYSYTWTVAARDRESATEYALEQIEENTTIGDLYVVDTYTTES